MADAKFRDAARLAAMGLEEELERQISEAAHETNQDSPCLVVTVAMHHKHPN